MPHNDHKDGPLANTTLKSNIQMTNDTNNNDGDQTTSSPTTTKNSKFTAENEQYSTASQNTSRDFVSVNDGTLRITIKWKPQNYESLTQDDDQWNNHAIEMLSDILNHPLLNIQLAPWSTPITDNSNLLQANLLNVNNLQLFFDLLKSASIFGIRISTPDKLFSIGMWLASPVIKVAIARHNIDLKVSNSSTCDSGIMVTA